VNLEFVRKTLCHAFSYDKEIRRFETGWACNSNWRQVHSVLARKCGKENGLGKEIVVRLFL
jgi:hypothetical protein